MLSIRSVNDKETIDNDGKEMAEVESIYVLLFAIIRRSTGTRNSQ